MCSEFGQKETPGPLNRKRPRKESRGQCGEGAAIVAARQNIFHPANRFTGA